jgi:hypothetical protein
VPADHRESPRLDLLGTVPGEVSVLAPISIRDISHTGVLGECAFPLLIGSAHELRLHLGSYTVVVTARVIRCEVADLGHELVRYVAGLEFIDLPPHAASAIAAFIDEVRQQRAAAERRADGPA